jgi:hypothetical protein
VDRDFDAVFAKLRELKASALIIGQDVYFNAESARLAALTVAMRSPRSTRCRSSLRLEAYSATVPAGAMRGAKQASMSDGS